MQVESLKTLELGTVEGVTLVADVRRIATKDGVQTSVVVREPRQDSGDWLDDLTAEVKSKSASRSKMESWDEADDYTASYLIDECRTEIYGKPMLAGPIGG